MMNNKIYNGLPTTGTYRASLGYIVWNGVYDGCLRTLRILDIQTYKKATRMNSKKFIKVAERKYRLYLDAVLIENYPLIRFKILNANNQKKGIENDNDA